MKQQQFLWANNSIGNIHIFRILPVLTVQFVYPRRLTTTLWMPIWFCMAKLNLILSQQKIWKFILKICSVTKLKLAGIVMTSPCLKLKLFNFFYTTLLTFFSWHKLVTVNWYSYFVVFKKVHKTVMCIIQWFIYNSNCLLIATGWIDTLISA